MRLHMTKYKENTIHYAKTTAQLSFKSRFPKNGPTYRRQVVTPRHQTPEGQSVAKPAECQSWVARCDIKWSDGTMLNPIFNLTCLNLLHIEMNGWNDLVLVGNGLVLLGNTPLPGTMFLMIYVIRGRYQAAKSWEHIMWKNAYFLFMNPCHNFPPFY